MTQPKTHSEMRPASDFRERIAEKLRALRGPDGSPAPSVSREEEHRARVARARERAGWRLPGLGVPDDAIDPLATASDTPALVTAREWWASGGRCLLLFGDIGVGKTTGAAWCLREAIAEELAELLPSGSEIRRREPAAFALTSTVARMSMFGHDATEAIERLCTVGLLVLDDFGREKLGDVAEQLFGELLTRRLGSKRCRTVITSNLSKAELATRVGDRIVDRLSQHATSVVLVGDSLRKRAQP